MKNKIKNFLYDDDELEDFKKLLNDKRNKKFLSNFGKINVLLPVSLIILGVFWVGIDLINDGKLFVESDHFWYSLFNGSMPLLGINILILGHFSLTKHNKQKEDSYGVNFSYLRSNSMLYFSLLLVIGAALYLNQTASAPFDSSLMRILHFVTSIGLIYFAWKFSRRVLLLEEDKIDNVFSLKIEDEKELNDITLKKGLLTKKD